MTQPAKPTAEDMALDMGDSLARLDFMIERWGDKPPKEWVKRRATLRRAIFAEAILNAPRVMLFADGREPTTNERHLANLLEWSQQHARQAKEEAMRLQGIIDGLADRVAQQSHLLSRKAEVGQLADLANLLRQRVQALRERADELKQREQEHGDCWEDWLTTQARCDEADALLQLMENPEPKEGR